MAYDGAIDMLLMEWRIVSRERLVVLNVTEEAGWMVLSRQKVVTGK